MWRIIDEHGQFFLGWGLKLLSGLGLGLPSFLGLSSDSQEKFPSGGGGSYNHRDALRWPAAAASLVMNVTDAFCDAFCSVMSGNFTAESRAYNDLRGSSCYVEFRLLFRPKTTSYWTLLDQTGDRPFCEAQSEFLYALNFRTFIHAPIMCSKPRAIGNF